MRPFLGTLLLLIPLAVLDGCISDSKGVPADSDSDTSDVFPNGTRKPRMPRVTYRTHDSLVHLRILGANYGDEAEYWIYRNDILLEQPLPHGWISVGPDSGSYLYTLSDGLESPGTYRYHVRYGYRESFLSRPSPTFYYAYPGRSPSGSVSLDTGLDERIRITLSHADSVPVSQAYFERKIGSDGKVEALDTVVKSGSGPFIHVDTAFLHLDTVVYYRAAAMHAGSERWLEPTAWDSIRVSNREWNYTPSVEFRNLGNGIRAEIADALGFSGAAWYILYRNDSPSRDGKTAVDSVAMQGAMTFPLVDKVSRPGAFHYWVEAKDPYGRVSLRSAPQRIDLTGISKGPDILGIFVYPGFLKITTARIEGASAYILYRGSGDGRGESVVDTLSVNHPEEGPTFVDIPPADGRWSYRLASLAGGEASAPGDWKQSDYFRYAPTYGRLTADFANRGPSGVEATVAPFEDARFHLIRSSRKDESDSRIVDSIGPADSRLILKDKPPVGTWYYRVVRREKPSTFSSTLYRTDLVEVAYTGKATGPAIKSVIPYGAGIEIQFSHDPDAIAYVVERSPDSAQAWTAVDTLSPIPALAPVHVDRPPKNGYWSYRLRSLLPGLALTDPGLAVRTATPWTFRVTYDNSLVAAIGNRGPRVECPLTTLTSYGYYLKRSLLGDYSDPITVDSLSAGAARNTLEDVPPAGIHYYWVERMLEADQRSGSIYRSAPFRVEFTGAPEIISLAKATRGVDIRYVQVDLGDTLEIWRSSGSSADTAAFLLLGGATATFNAARFEDTTVEAGPPSFYHYRLVLRRDGKATAKGPIKSLYYQR